MLIYYLIHPVGQDPCGRSKGPLLLESYKVAIYVSARAEISSEARLGKNPNSKVPWLLALLRSLRVSVSFLSGDQPPLLGAWPFHMAAQSMTTSFFIARVSLA